MKNGKSSKWVSWLLGGFLIIIGVVMFVHDASFIFTGKTVDLNEILKNGGELPRDKYVTYTCEVPLGSYAETTTRAGGIIPLPGKTVSYAFYAENNMIMTIAASKKSLKTELDDQADAYYYYDETKPVKVTGCFQVNSADVDRLLEQYITQGGLNGEDITLSSYCIDTTKTRPKLAVMYTLMILLGAAVILVTVRSKNRI